MSSPSTRVLAWAAAWESRNPDKVAALYAREATHASAVVSQLYPEARASMLKGRDQIREYARRGMDRFTTLRFEIVSVVRPTAARPSSTFATRTSTRISLNTYWS